LSLMQLIEARVHQAAYDE